MPFTSYDHARDMIDRARAVLAGANTPGLPVGVPTDIRRLAVVMGVAAIDTYMHRLIVTRVYEHQTLPGALATLDVPFEALLGEADEAVAARREARATRPRVRLKRVLRNRLQRATFQRADDVSKALAMAGRSGQWDNIAAAMGGAWTAKALRRRLDGIVDRRNAIVHEGDYERLDRPQVARLQPISASDAAADIDFVSDLVDAIRSVV